MNEVILAIQQELDKVRRAGEPAHLIVYSDSPFKLSMLLLKALTNIHIFSRLDIEDPVTLLRDHIRDNYHRSVVEFEYYHTKKEPYRVVDLNQLSDTKNVKLIMDVSQ